LSQQVKERQNYFIIGGWKEGKKERKEARKKKVMR